LVCYALIRLVDLLGFDQLMP